jgi:cyclophilin family peptidyl-prolyl cis-trans isomerase
MSTPRIPQLLRNPFPYCNRITIFILSLALGLLASCSQPKTEPVVELVTNKGTMTIQLHPDYAPKTVELFLQHVDAGFYNGTVFHRVIPEFMAQGGGFNENFERKEPLGTVVNESIGGLPNLVGTIAMARTSNPDSASSQFYINVVDNPNLDAREGRPGYTVFGIVIKGLEIAIEITKMPRGQHAGTGNRNAPNESVIISTAQRIKPARALEFEIPVPQFEATRAPEAP